jgi:transmembrane sensor
MAEIEHNQEVTERAAAWIARLDGGELSTDDLIELRDWVRANPAHMRELERLGDIWKRLDSLAALDGLLAAPPPPVSKSRWSLGIAAGIVAVVAASALVFSRLPAPESVEVAAVYATDIGEQKSIEPGEGSTINLNTASRVTLDFSASLRRVELSQGEAFFDVDSDDGRPFIVATRHGDVVVKGTAFLVRVEEDGLEVVVKEGYVEVHEQSTGSGVTPPVASLKAGEVARIDDAGSARIDAVEPEIMIRKLGWRDGMLMFDGNTLDEVVHEVSRYTPVNIVIEDAALRERRIGGYFRVGEVEDLMATLENDFGIQVNRVNDNEIRLTAPIN